MLNYDLAQAGEERRLQLSELKKIRAEGYEIARSYKERAMLDLIKRELSYLVINIFLGNSLPQE